jgi:hypothetical protein
VIQREVAEIQTAYMIAKRFPRDPIQAMDRILNACARPTLAEVAIYEYARGGTKIDGPSVRLAEALAQAWGNLNAGVTILSSRTGESECIAYAVDLESGYREERRFTVKHWRDTKNGGYAIKDERDIYELAANMGARRKRACILAVIPGDVVEAAVSQCSLTLATKMEVTPERLKSLLEKFSEFGVTQEQIEGRIQRRLDAMTPALMVGLGKVYNSMKDGMSKPSDWFGAAAGADGPDPSDAPSKGTAGVKERLKKAVKVPADPGPTPSPPSVLDDVTALRMIDGAQDEERAGEILDAYRGTPHYARLVEAFNARWRTTV